MPPKTIPQLPSSDYDETAAFYGRLGFTERARWPDEYLILLRETDDIELHFWSGRVDPLKNDSSCYVRFDTAEEARSLHAEWARANLPPDGLRELVETDYGLLEFALVDPDGNLIRVGGSLQTSG